VRYLEGKLVTEQKALPISVEVFDGGSGVKEVKHISK